MTIPGLYFAAAPTRDQTKKIWWEDLKKLTFEPTHKKEPMVSTLVMYLANGSEIHVIGLDECVFVMKNGSIWNPFCLIGRETLWHEFLDCFHISCT